MSSQTYQPKEKKVEDHLRREIEKIGGRCLKFVAPGNRFVPDRICLFAERIFFIECKRSPKKEPSSGQIRELARLNKNGHLAILISTKEEVNELCSTLISGRSIEFSILRRQLLSRFGYGVRKDSSLTNSNK